MSAIAAKYPNLSLSGKDLLNAVQKMLIEFANSKGIILAQEFGNVQAFKQFVIAFTMKSLMEIGVPVQDAFDMVFGDNAYNDLAERVWLENNPA